MRKKPDALIVPLQSKMFAAGIRVTEACLRAKVSPQTWSRWAAGGAPDLPTFRRFEATVDEIIAEDEAETAALEPEAEIAS